MNLLLDEMYGLRLAETLRSLGIEVATVADRHLVGAPDTEIFAAARAARSALLTENVADFVRIAAEHGSSGGHQFGLLIALSSRFSRRPSGTDTLAAAIRAVADETLDDRIVYLERRTP